MKSGVFGGSGATDFGRGTFNPQASSISGMLNLGPTATAPIKLRGQDKALQPSLGANPNVNVEDEYIHNLQQQIHFMELELKILKEKVVEDEKNTGIGSLFNDDKNAHEHISELKIKYARMRKEYDKAFEDLEKEQVRVLGE